MLSGSIVISQRYKFRVLRKEYRHMCNNMSNKNSGVYSVRCNIKKAKFDEINSKIAT